MDNTGSGGDAWLFMGHKIKWNNHDDVRQRRDISFMKQTGTIHLCQPESVNFVPNSGAMTVCWARRRCWTASAFLLPVRQLTMARKSKAHAMNCDLLINFLIYIYILPLVWLLACGVVVWKRLLACDRRPSLVSAVWCREAQLRRRLWNWTSLFLFYLARCLNVLVTFLAVYISWTLSLVCLESGDACFSCGGQVLCRLRPCWRQLITNRHQDTTQRPSWIVQLVFTHLVTKRKAQTRRDKNMNKFVSKAQNIRGVWVRCNWIDGEILSQVKGRNTHLPRRWFDTLLLQLYWY